MAEQLTGIDARTASRLNNFPLCRYAVSSSCREVKVLGNPMLKSLSDGRGSRCAAIRADRAHRSPGRRTHLCGTGAVRCHPAGLRSRPGRFYGPCRARAVTALPAEPQTLAAYLADLALTARPATIGRKLAAIAVAHRDAGLESPTEHGMVKRTLAGIRREKGTAPHQNDGMTTPQLE